MKHAFALDGRDFYFGYHSDKSRHINEGYLRHLLQQDALEPGNDIPYNDQSTEETEECAMDTINFFEHIFIRLNPYLQIRPELFDLVEQVKQRIEGFLSKYGPNCISALQICYALIRSKSFYDLIHGI